MADLLFGIVVFYGLVLGARRGFYKEVVHVLALVVSISVARSLRVKAGAVLAARTGAPVLVSEVLAVAAVWVIVFFVVALLGRLVLKKLRGKGVDDRLEAGAEDVADAIAGDTTKGPITLLTDPIASRRGVFYWSDKLLGALLGLLKGVLTGYILFGIALYADRVGYENAFARSVEGSYAGALFVRELDPYLRQFPEYQLAVKLTDMREIARLVHEDPRRFDIFAGDPQLGSLARDPRVQALASDPEVKAAWARHDLRALLLNPKVRALLADPELREKVAVVDWAKVREAVERGPGATPR
jgi:uncharacterized membrane protein required for colicin V production